MDETENVERSHGRSARVGSTVLRMEGEGGRVLVPFYGKLVEESST
jgi:hypothetical protein